MIVAAAEISLRNRSHTMRAVSELNASITAGEVGANKVLSMLSIFRNDEVSGLSFTMEDW